MSIQICFQVRVFDLLPPMSADTILSARIFAN